MKVTLIKSEDEVRVEFENGSAVVGDEDGGLLSNSASLNNEQAQDLLENLLEKEPGTYDV